MNDSDYENLFKAYVEFAITCDDRYQIKGLIKTHYIVDCDPDMLTVLQDAFDKEMQHNQDGLRRLSEKVAGWYAYVLVANLSTQVVVNVDPMTTFATVIDTPHRNGLLRWAAKQNLVCYSSELELKPQADRSNVVQVVF